MYNVMLVDDERWVRTSVRSIVEETRMPVEIVHECSNGREALNWLQENPVDLVLTDIRMPVMDGIALLKTLSETRPQIHVVLISGYSDFQYAQEAVRSGVHDYLLKPVELEQMQDCLKRFLDKKGYKAAEQSTTERILQIIHEALPGEISLTEVAQQVHLNPSYVSQLFKKEMSRTFVDYVVELRMEEAKKLLSKTSLRVSEVAERLGYEDLSYFCKSFKRVTGLTPNAFRRELQPAQHLRS